MNEPIFTAAPFFLFRAPVWTKEDYDAIVAHENKLLELFDNNLDLQHAIRIASSSLYTSLKERPLKKPKQVLASLYQYAVRMSTRATPFGLFSFVASGNWSEKTNATFDIKSLKKQARPDMQWLWNVLQKHYQDDYFTTSLPVKAHPLITFQGQRASIDYRYFSSHDTPAKPVSIRATSLIRSILSLAHEAISFDKLWEALKSPDLDKEKTLELVQKLLQEQFLLPGDIPSLLSSCPWKTVSTYIPTSIIQKIDLYNSNSIEQEDALFDSIQDEMQAVAQSKNMLQVDLVHTRSKFQLPTSVKDELEKAMSVWWKISTGLKPVSPLKRYFGRFLEKYGTCRTVPLLELLSQDKGLGSFEQTPHPSESKFATIWKKWLQQEWQRCIKTDQKEIVLTEEILDRLFTLSHTMPSDPKEAMNSFELFCHVVAESEEQIDNREFLVHFSDLTWQAGSAFGRFLPLFDTEFHESLSTLYCQEEKLDPGTLYVMPSYWPASVRYANVATQTCVSDFKLDIFGKKDASCLSLSDIYVGVTQSRFYLTLKEGGREVILRPGNMLNPKSAPLALQFMRLVSLERSNKVLLFSLPESLQETSYMPRVRFHKTLLAAAKWRFDTTFVHNESHDCIAKRFTEWADRWHLPTQCTLVHEDQLLLINRTDPVCMDEIIQKCRKGHTLEFSEPIQSFWATSQRGHHFTEIVVPFVKNMSFSKKEPSVVACSYHAISPDIRWKLPGSEWLSAKFYLQPDKKNSFLLEQLYTLIQKSNLSNWFFVRYNDPEPHIRLRIKLSSLHDLTETLSSIQHSALEWLQEGYIQNMVFSPYEREIERYGGIELIDTIEELFHIDSMTVLSCLHLPLEKPVLRALSVVSFLQDGDFSLDEMRRLLQCPDEYLNGFRTYKNQLFTLVGQLQPTDSRAAILRKITSLSQTLPVSKRLHIYKSLLHMHCNRHGCNETEEKQACKYAEQLLLKKFLLIPILTNKVTF